MRRQNISVIQNENHAPSYISVTITAVKSWLNHFDVKILRKLKIRNPTSTPTLKDEKIPEPQELAELFNRADTRAGAIMALIGKAGLRPEVLGNVDASDGLSIRDLPDLAIVQGLAIFTHKPARIVVRSELSKKDNEYFTFITNEGSKKLLAYLNERIMSGKSLGPDDAVIAPNHRYKYGRGNNTEKKFLVTGVIRREVRNTMRPRFNWRPYVLRRFFDTQLLIAESRGKIAHDFRVFFMGHKGSIEAVYTTNKGILPQSLITEMRDAFKRSEELLDLEIIQEDPIEAKKEEVKEKIETMTAQQLAQVQELLSVLDNGKTKSSNESSHQMKQSSVSLGVGVTSVLCQTEKLSSKDMFRTHSESGLGGLRSLDL
ncbi:hypothetical protein SCCGRSA3_02478 [Marine Group I thaumarchaeote SCGC RSA3]|uniref:Integrase family protein n=2 Tax=Marine Group I TaxID=905826 RepID=A0A087RMF5_9ARCH|nr:hypothetical protein AAA799D11_01665 [Marine Group I thaumarchaeote SCGC AAA799-D11]KFM16247.1 hypothetical protein SCCGRSA3_02478 [Marine Group I thaumarchaeote SCGC RSA3]